MYKHFILVLLHRDTSVAWYIEKYITYLECKGDNTKIITKMFPFAT